MGQPFRITPPQRAQFDRDGYFITEPLFDAAMLKSLRAEFDRLWDEDIRNAEKSGDAKQKELTKLRPFIGHVHTRSERCMEFCRDAVFQHICSELIGPDADLYYNQAVMKPPGKGKQFAWHQDSYYIITQPLEYVTCWVAVSDATVDNGTIWIAPGSHQQGLLPHINSEENREWDCQFDDRWKIPVVLRAGQIAVFSSLLPHKSGPNISNEPRYAYVVQYHVASVKHRDNPEPAGDQTPIIRGNRAVETAAAK